MLSKLFSKPINDSLTLDQLDQLNTLIESRVAQIATSQDYVGKSRVYCDPDQDLLYFLKTENPLPGTIFCHPISRKPSAILESTSQAGRVAVSFISFATTVNFFQVNTSFDYTRYRSFSKLVATSWNDIPATLSESELTLQLPLSYKPDPSVVVLYSNTAKHFRILTVQELETHNLCTVEPVDVN